MKRAGLFIMKLGGLRHRYLLVSIYSLLISNELAKSLNSVMNIYS